MSDTTKSKVTNGLRGGPIVVCRSFAEAEMEDRRFWHSRSPLERWQALELMRQAAFGYDPLTTRFQRVLEIARRIPG